MMKNVVLTVAALLVAALVAWPTVAGVAPSSPSPEAAPAGAEVPEAPAPEISTPAPETPSGDLQLEPIAAASGGDDCNCLDVWDPVCGSNGVTYSNACYAECDGVTDYTEGTC
ncbi:MAG: Kazal-type serine protease inhibitor domain-containing protein [Thermoanaerobaculia bacterium]